MIRNKDTRMASAVFYGRTVLSLCRCSLTTNLFISTARNSLFTKNYYYVPTLVRSESCNEPNYCSSMKIRFGVTFSCNKMCKFSRCDVLQLYTNITTDNVWLYIDNTFWSSPPLVNENVGSSISLPAQISRAIHQNRLDELKSNRFIYEYDEN
jgi:hypothetical protein